MQKAGRKEEYRIILASQSPRRIQLLRQIGLEAEVRPSRLLEEMDSGDPETVVGKLSFQKAEEIARQLSEEREDGNILVIGADTVVASDGKILGKPESHEAAYEMLRGLAGKKHQVYTGVSLILGEKRLGFVEKTEVELYPMTEEELRDYADSEEPMDKAGAYGIQGSFAKYIRGIHGDYHNVMGLPLARLYHAIKRLEALPELCGGACEEPA